MAELFFEDFGADFFRAGRLPIALFPVFFRVETFFATFSLTVRFLAILTAAFFFGIFLPFLFLAVRFLEVFWVGFFLETFFLVCFLVLTFFLALLLVLVFFCGLGFVIQIFFCNLLILLILEVFDEGCSRGSGEACKWESFHSPLFRK